MVCQGISMALEDQESRISQASPSSVETTVRNRSALTIPRRCHLLPAAHGTSVPSSVMRAMENCLTPLPSTTSAVRSGRPVGLVVPFTSSNGDSAEADRHQVPASVAGRSSGQSARVPPIHITPSATSSSSPSSRPSSTDSVDSGIASMTLSPSTSPTLTLSPVWTQTSQLPQSSANSLPMNDTARVMCDADLERLGSTMRGLQDACFYYPDLDSDAARALLASCPVGTFLVRNSSDCRFLFAITMQTERGATSVRVLYENGLFQLDCQGRVKGILPRFETLLELLDFHRTLYEERQDVQFRWQESSNRQDLAAQLAVPRRHSPPALSHQARVAVNRTLQDLHMPARSTDLLPVPSALKLFLRAYPYKV